MTSKKTKKLIRRLKAILPYFVTGAITLAIVFFGSLDKSNASMSSSLDAFADGKSSISVDQLSELYVVAGVSDSLSLASSADVASNYVAVSSMYNSGQSSTGKIEKPTITDIDVTRGVLTHLVTEGETMDAIAARYGVTTDQIRWSNGRKNKNINAGELLYIPSVGGIVYTVKANDTVASIASKYGSSEAEIIALNDLEVSGITSGMKILIKGGTLPEKERPEYVAPVVRVYSTYTYVGDTSQRINGVCNRSLGAGQCTTWGWAKRPDLAPLMRANANRWDDIARANGILVDHNPTAGAIFQSDSGWYGHVGYVESVNADGSVNVSERNYRGCYGVLFSTIPADTAKRLNYIH